MIRKLLTSALCGFALCAAANAGTIDFESIGEGFNIGTVDSGDNHVAFRVYTGDPTDLNNWTHATVAGVGGPQTAFVPDDTPTGGNAGERFLTDEQAGPLLAKDYLIWFVDTPVSSLSLDLYDFRGDGGASAGDIATLKVYSDFLTTEVGSTNYTIPVSQPPDGNAVTLSVNAPSIKAATLSFSMSDVGTGIDNVTFTNVPEPTGLALLFGCLGVIGWFRRQ